MRKIILIALLLLPCLVWGSGGYDNGTATGKGKFQLDLTWNPFDRFDFGQTYGVMSYGLTDRFDLHGYISRQKGPYHTWYGGIFYQFYKSKRIDLASAVGIRKRFDETWTHIFSPQLLYTGKITDKISIGGSVVNVRNYESSENYGLTFDIAFAYKTSIQSEIIESISIGIGGFHPATWNPDSFFLPTYSVDIKFK